MVGRIAVFLKKSTIDIACYARQNIAPKAASSGICHWNFKSSNGFAEPHGGRRGLRQVDVKYKLIVT